MMAEPLVSVVMPVYNSATTVEAAVRSILRQTVRDLELIIVDDGSTDGSHVVVQGIRDERIRLFRNDQNRGVSFSRNRGLDVMRGHFMAPMDADDVCYPKRLELALHVLNQNSGLGACGGWALWKGWGGKSFIARLPWGPDAVEAYLLYGMPSPHDALLFRVSMLRKHQIRYPENQQASDDYDFYRCCAKVAGVDNVPAVLVQYRCTPGGISNTRAIEATTRRLAGLREELLKLFPAGVDDPTLRFHARVGNGTGAADVQELNDCRAWLAKIDKENLARCVYAPDGLSRATAMVWFAVCRNSAHLGKHAWRAWYESPWCRWYRPEPVEFVSFAGSWLLSLLLPSRRRAQGALAGL